MAKGEKHSLVQCRIEACQKVDEIVKVKECTIRDAMRQLAGEEGVPFGTLKYWYYMDDESNKAGLKVQPPKVPVSTPEVKAKVAAKIVKNFAKAIKKDEEDGLAAQANRDGAHALAEELGGAVVAEELYELFLTAVSRVDEVVAANKELAEPMNTDNMVSQLLRLARNVGWVEPVVEEPESTTCTKCHVVSCPNRMCKNHVPKKKVKTTSTKPKKKEEGITSGK